MWSFDGSSTLQAEGGDSDCLLKPVFICPDPDRINGFLVMCEVLNADGTPHSTNGRATIDEDDDDFWFGYEQEYFCGTLRQTFLMASPVTKHHKDSFTAQLALRIHSEGISSRITWICVLKLA